MRDPQNLPMKSMKLYDQVGRIHSELLALGIDGESPLAVEDLTPFDQYHYHGTAAVDAAIAALGLEPASRVLEVGSGIGGPARYMADSAGCSVTALELQDDLHRTAEGLTDRCKLRGQVHHLLGDMLEGPCAGADFDALVSFLVFLHIPDRARLFDVCFASLRPGGAIFIEDLTKLKEPSPAQWAGLQEKVFCSYLPTADDYRAHLEGAGFTEISVEDMGSSWHGFTIERDRGFVADRDRHLSVHGQDITEGLGGFYRIMAELYADGVLGGLRIRARRP